MRRRATVVIAVLLAGCGGSGDEPERAEPAPAPRMEAVPAPRPERPDTRVPAGSERVIRAWLAAIRAADFEKAASYFAIPSRVQNGGPPRTLDNPARAIAWNATLPCGAILTGIRGGPDGFAIAEFELTDRKGSKCGSGLGAPAASAIRVKEGRITDWVRLPDGEAPEPGVLARRTYSTSTALYL